MTFNSQISSPFLTRLSKGIKRKRKRTRNHRPTRKRKTRFHGHKDNQKYVKHVKNNACKRILIDREMVRQVSSIIDVNKCSCWGTNQQKAKKIPIDPSGVKKLSRRQEPSQSIHQVSRSYRDCNKKKLKKLDRQQSIEEVSN